MHEPLLKQAASPVPRIVLGVKLRRYSIGHELLIQTDTDFPDPTSALAAAVYICSSSWRQNTNRYNDLLAGLKMRLWDWRVRRNKFDVVEEMEKFGRYRKEGSLELPPSEVIDPNKRFGRLSGAPYLLRLQQFMMLRLGLSEERAWDYPLGLANMRWATFWEEEGGYNVKNSKEASFEQFVEKQEQLRKERKAKQCQA